MTFRGDEPVDVFADEHRHRPSDAPDRPPSLKPLDLGETTLLPRWSWNARQKQSHVTRPSISAPYQFRRLDNTDAQSQSLVPLRLGPVILRESPVPPESNSPTTVRPSNANHRERSDSREDLLSQTERRQSYRMNRRSTKDTSPATIRTVFKSSC